MIQYHPAKRRNRYIGGYFTSVETQAREQAEMASLVLKGTPVAEIPIKEFTQKGYILIDYEYREEERHIHIFVEDTGIGIPKEKQDAVFNRFTKLDEFAKGTGLGLSICKAIAERFDGYIAVESEIGKGSRFSIILPLNPKHTESD